MASHAESGFVAAFENFWNSYACRRRDLAVVVCGSAAAWMIRNVVNARGGLHNRLTRRIRLEPFNLHEVQQYLQYERFVGTSTKLYWRTWPLGESHTI